MNTEIDCSALLASPSYAPWDCCNSVANLGRNAGRLTWQASQRFASALVLTEGQKEAFREFVRSSGGWDEEETAAFSDTDLTALCVQWVSGDIREDFGDDVSDDPTRWDWDAHREDCDAGRASGRLYLIGGKLIWSCAQ